jgi:hypothetical protein
VGELEGGIVQLDGRDELAIHFHHEWRRLFPSAIPPKCALNSTAVLPIRRQIAAQLPKADKACIVVLADDAAAKA